MTKLGYFAKTYADRNFKNDAIKHDVAYHSFCDGFNQAMRMLMEVGNIIELDKRISPFNYIKDENN